MTFDQRMKRVFLVCLLVLACLETAIFGPRWGGMCTLDRCLAIAFLPVIGGTVYTLIWGPRV